MCVCVCVCVRVRVRVCVCVCAEMRGIYLCGTLKAPVTCNKSTTQLNESKILKRKRPKINFISVQRKLTLNITYSFRPRSGEGLLLRVSEHEQPGRPALVRPRIRFGGRRLLARILVPLLQERRHRHDPRDVRRTVRVSSLLTTPSNSPFIFSTETLIFSRACSSRGTYLLSIVGVFVCMFVCGCVCLWTVTI